MRKWISVNTNPLNEPTDMSGPRTVQFQVFRYDASAGDAARFQSYELSVAGKTSVLEALLQIQNEQDPSLAFRYACRGAVCGSCAMSINGRLNLACRVLLDAIPGDRIVLEPLPHLAAIKDLVVDMGPFWEKYERVRPWLQERLDDARQGRLSEAENKRIEPYVNCILCALCYGACPVLDVDGQFTGPAALAKLYRFVADSRDDPAARTLQSEDNHHGAWGCRAITRCIDVCPKNVRPTDGIAGLKRTLLSQRLRQVPAGSTPGRQTGATGADLAPASSSPVPQTCAPASIERRQFLGGMIAGGAAALAAGAAGPMAAYVGNLRAELPPPFLVLPEAEAGLAPGKSAIIRYGRLPVLLFMTPDGAIRAFVALCTHFDCIVGYRSEENRIFCACHEGYYDVEGNVVAGPPPRPLRRLHCQARHGKLFLAMDIENLEKALRTHD